MQGGVTAVLPRNRAFLPIASAIPVPSDLCLPHTTLAGPILLPAEPCIELHYADGVLWAEHQTCMGGPTRLW